MFFLSAIFFLIVVFDIYFLLSFWYSTYVYIDTHLKFPTFLWGSVSISSFHFFLCISRLHISIHLSPNSHILSSGSSLSTVSPSNEFWESITLLFYSEFPFGSIFSYSNMNIFIISNLKFVSDIWTLLSAVSFSLFSLYFLVVVHFSYNGSDWYFIACLIYYCCLCHWKHVK